MNDLAWTNLLMFRLRRQPMIKRFRLTTEIHDIHFLKVSTRT